MLRVLGALVMYGALGAGLGWWIHPGAGIAGVALLLYFDAYHERDTGE